MTERMKPPARPKGRVLGGAARKAAGAPPPPAELTRDQLTAEQEAVQTPNPAVVEPETQPAAALAPHDKQTTETEPSPAMRHAAATPSQHVGDAGHATATLPEQRAPEATPSAPPPEAAPPVGLAQRTEVAVRQTISAPTSSTAFPVRSGAPGPQYEQHVSSDPAPSDETPWAQGPGRPKGIPEAAIVLNQRIITRESLDASVPAALKIKKRIKRFALDNELDHLPIGDIVSVALDEWLTTRGF
ncbi:hypothetical protein OG478_12345 [Streptomyces phaeochromogenes]|uniref:hypothetical protein n=1 Tax=Streptomyces phaeochromogenes TaxID=1923 RepID=UPI003866B2B1|nr:hypothetical protein OG478_12345 [Streptomyces phaeochromogenes]